jgi:hypothetical protein
MNAGVSVSGNKPLTITNVALQNKANIVYHNHKRSYRKKLTVTKAHKKSDNLEFIVKKDQL